MKSKNGNCANNGGKWIRPEKRMAIYMRDGLRCTYCEKTVENTVLTLDHIVPQQLGGTNHETNLITACKKCNSAKGQKTLRQFMTYLKKQGVEVTNIPKRIRRLTAKTLPKIK